MMAPEDAFRLLADSLGSTGTPRVFDLLVERLAAIFEAEHALIAELLPDGETLRTVAGWSQGQLQPAVTYPLAGTPCAHVLDDQACHYPDNVCARFPDDPLLREMGVTSYMGVPIKAPDGQLLGLMAILDSQPLALADYAPEVLRIAAAQAGAELARQAAERERRSSHHRIEQLAFWDSVTGLPNRRHFMERLNDSFDRASRQGSALGLVYLDLQRFRQINDTQGHALGDRLLAAIAARFGAVTAPGEFVARLGGDEFMVLLMDTDPAAMAGAIERYRRSLSPPIPIAERRFAIAASAGAALFPSDAEDAQSLFQHASIALNHAKRSGDRTRFFSPSMADELYQREVLQVRFIDALARNGLSLHFQPQFCLVSGKLIGAEALCRWQDDTLGWVSPGDFIPLAEEQGLIGRLGDWVLDAACRQLERWEAQGKAFPGRLCVNVSAQQMDDPQLAEHVQRLTARVAPGRIGLELTESGLMRNPDQTVSITRALRAAGFGMAIDDFGTGYSSLTYLKRFAADTLKIDMSFVQDMLESSHDRAIVATIIAMAQTLGMRTVAEGVETHDQAEALKALGCSGVQGFYFGRPVDADSFAAHWL
ncbi:sensor domain-containing phosphodiesterase [Halomonas campisalis]|uniref:Sensor domain-containing phosphodiesterase n=1 Tax=Billgrantia campisalis TaxID=74661 RepID=A0ABS9P7K4_9GAMM|nr:sensor domain-containing phosphodiesterase [Halomonas campisalis]MCG6657756.1 sensor domain-containing phosphodiesterase [Halomonas campisalis]MDR5862472.1 sensor domain-containing phosphodiesterase [Halomonas campisalis]